MSEDKIKKCELDSLSVAINRIITSTDSTFRLNDFNNALSDFRISLSIIDNPKYLKKDIKLDLKYFLDDLNTEKDSLSYDQYFYNGFNYTLKYMDKNGYLMKTKIIIELDSLIVNCNRYNKRFYNK